MCRVITNPLSSTNRPSVGRFAIFIHNNGFKNKIFACQILNSKCFSTARAAARAAGTFHPAGHIRFQRKSPTKIMNTCLRINIQIKNNIFRMFIRIELFHKLTRTQYICRTFRFCCLCLATTRQINATAFSGFVFPFARTDVPPSLCRRRDRLTWFQSSGQPVSLDNIIYTHSTPTILDDLIYIIRIRHTRKLVNIIIRDNTHLDIHHE